jgi:transcriptional regulator with XRE-family HTH domain
MNAAQLKAWRLERKLSQAAAAERIGCSRRSIQQWESGANPVPDYIAMAVAAASMNLPPYGTTKR